MILETHLQPSAKDEVLLILQFKAVPYGVQIIITNAPKRTIRNNYFRKNISRSLLFANQFYELRTSFPFLNFSCVKLSNAFIGLVVTSSPCSRCATRGSAATLRSALSASWAYRLYCTRTAVMACL